MTMSLHIGLYIIFSFICTDFISNAQDTPFGKDHIPLWGGDHVSIINQGREAQIKLDPSSGGGFRSKQPYKYGLFKINMKIPKDANGVVTTYYLTSIPDNGPDGAHSEVDFELLGRDNGPPYTLNTNVFAQDSGSREQQFKLWFDPTSDFHEYKIIWNQHLIVFFVDGIPIRVFENKIKIGAKYPTQSMYLHGSLWNGTQWLGPTNWSKGPFYANYRGFTIEGCWDKSKCSKLYQLDQQQQKMYENIKKSSLTFNYCNSKNSDKKFPECKQ